MPRIVHALLFLSGGYASSALLIGSLAFRRGVNRLLLAHAAMSACLSVFSVVFAQLLTASDAVRMDLWVRLGGFSVLMAATSGIAFVGHLLFPRLPTRYRISALVCAAVAVCALASPGGLRWEHVGSVVARSTPWGDRVYEERGPHSPLGLFLVYAASAPLGFMPLVDAVRLRPPWSTRLPVLVSSGALSLLWICDIAVDLGWRRGTSIAVFGYLVVYAFLTTWTLAREQRLAAVEEERRHAEKLRALGQLAGSVAHDFNNLLTGILGAAELLESKVAHDPRATELVSIVLDAGGRARELTTQVLSYARGGRATPEVHDLHELVAATVALVERTFDPSIRIACTLDARHPFFVGDRAQIQAALLNLCVNARDAMPRGGELRVVCDDRTVEAGEDVVERFSLAPGDYLRVRVTDTGQGMSAAVRSRVFEPFYTTKAAGTGLGLASTYGAIVDHHGAILCESEEGRGTTFEILVPRHH